MKMINCVQLKAICISSPNFNENKFFEFLNDEKLDWIRSGGSNAEELVEVSGRICYLSFGKDKQSPRDNRKYIENLIKQGHESVLEHVNWTFVLTGISRAFSHQLVRHRVGFAYSQLSQQYHDDSGASFVVPPSIAKNEKLFIEWSKNIHLPDHHSQMLQKLK